MICDTKPLLKEGNRIMVKQTDRNRHEPLDSVNVGHIDVELTIKRWGSSNLKWNDAVIYEKF